MLGPISLGPLLLPLLLLLLLLLLEEEEDIPGGGNCGIEFMFRALLLLLLPLLPKSLKRELKMASWWSKSKLSREPVTPPPPIFSMLELPPSLR